MRTPERDKLAARLRNRGIASAVYYERPLHGHLAPTACPLVPGGMPVADRLAAEVLSIPVHPHLDGGEQRRVVQAVREETA